jgi:transposase-like protein
MVIETGRPIAEVARDLRIHDGTLGNRVNAWRREHPEPDQPLGPTERVRVKEMEDEIRRLRMENEFLKSCGLLRADAPVLERCAVLDRGRRSRGQHPNGYRSKIETTSGRPSVTLQSPRWTPRCWNCSTPPRRPARRVSPRRTPPYRRGSRLTAIQRQRTASANAPRRMKWIGRTEEAASGQQMCPAGRRPLHCSRQRRSRARLLNNLQSAAANRNRAPRPHRAPVTRPRSARRMTVRTEPTRPCRGPHASRAADSCR